MNNKGQGLPLNTIIIAIIVIVVLVVIILIFTGQIGGVNEATSGERDCQAIGGTCVTPTFCGSIPGADCTTHQAMCDSRTTCMVR